MLSPLVVWIRFLVLKGTQKCHEVYQGTLEFDFFQMLKKTLGMQSQ
jgi:hypothetical protein